MTFRSRTTRRFWMADTGTTSSLPAFRRFRHLEQGAKPRGLQRRLRSQFAMSNRRVSTVRWRTSRRFWKSSAQRLVQPAVRDALRVRRDAGLAAQELQHSEHLERQPCCVPTAHQTVCSKHTMAGNPFSYSGGRLLQRKRAEARAGPTGTRIVHHECILSVCPGNARTSSSIATSSA